MYSLSGGCHCGNVRVDLELAREPATYRPRACDCDFCRKHAAAYLSDPQGTLTIRLRDASNTGSYRQGNSLAECLFCKNCGVLVGAIYRSGDRVIGVVNVKAIEGGTNFGMEQPVSPKALSGEEKIARWQDIWFSNVTIAIGEPPLGTQVS
jgi:hypothetical protein